MSKSLTLYVSHRLPLQYRTLHFYRVFKPLVFLMLNEFGVNMGMSQT